MINLSKVKIISSISTLLKGRVFTLFGFYLLTSLINNQIASSQTFTNPGNFSVTVPNYSGTVLPGDQIIVTIRAILVGGGGGGGRGEGAGGGGGGQVVEIVFTALQGDVFTGIVGAGGLGGTNPDSNGFGGGTTSFNGTTAAGGLGGFGGNFGAGGSSGSNIGGSGQIQGNRYAGGGGAGALTSGTSGEANASGNTIGGNGGLGRLGYGGGGGGSANKPGEGGTLSQGVGGTNGGTNGSTGNSTNALNGTGGGGGGGWNRGGNGGGGRVVVTYEYARVLPVEYLYFNASYNLTERAGELSWATAKEWENSHFDVERSVNDVKSWIVVDRIQGAGYSDGPVDYSFRDKNLPAAGGNIFYRLKQVDFDGKFVYSVTKAIQVKPTAGTSFWSVFPNPTSGNPISLRILNSKVYQDELISIRVISPTGAFELIEGRSEGLLSRELTEKLKNKPAGIFTLEISWGVFREYHKVILRP